MFFQGEKGVEPEIGVGIGQIADGEIGRDLNPGAVIGFIANTGGMKLPVDNPETYPGEEYLNSSNYDEPIAPVRELPLGLQIVLVALTLASGIYYLIRALRERSSAEPTALALYTCGGVAGCGVGVVLCLLMVGVL